MKYLSSFFYYNIFNQNSAFIQGAKIIFKIFGTYNPTKAIDSVSIFSNYFYFTLLINFMQLLLINKKQIQVIKKKY
jgi:hypothetical protein